MPEPETNSALREYYDRVLAPTLRRFEERRRGALRKTLFCCFVLPPVAAAIVMTMANSPDGWCIGALVTVAAAGGIAAILFNRALKGFKEELIAPLVKFISPELDYFPEDTVTEQEFAVSRIFLHDIDRFTGEDLVTGKVGATAIKFSELHAQYKTTVSNGKGGSRTEWHTIFKGVFFIADFNKDFQGVTVVLPDMAENIFGGVIGRALQKMNFTRPEHLVQLEDPDFEKMFAVYSTDQVQARYILTPALMQRLVALRRERGDISISFTRSCISIAIGSTKNRFEPKWFSGLDNFALVEEYYCDIKALTDIVDELNLNTRIWTKE